MKCRALNTQTTLAGDNIVIAQIHYRAIAHSPRTNAPDRRTACNRCGLHAELIQLTNSRGMQKHSRSKCHGGVVAIEVRYRVPKIPQSNCCGDSGDAIPNDRDIY
jgi:hypothetical protein